MRTLIADTRIPAKFVEIGKAEVTKLVRGVNDEKGLFIYNKASTTVRDGRTTRPTMTLTIKTRKPCCRKETARCRSCSFWLKVRQ